MSMHDIDDAFYDMVMKLINGVFVTFGTGVQPTNSTWNEKIKISDQNQKIEIEIEHTVPTKHLSKQNAVQSNPINWSMDQQKYIELKNYLSYQKHNNLNTINLKCIGQQNFGKEINISIN